MAVEQSNRRRYYNERRQKVLKNYHNNKIPGAEVLIDNVWDPHNVGATLRSADGLGISTIWFYYTFNTPPALEVETKKSSASANLWQPTANIENLEDFLREKKTQDCPLIAADNAPCAQYLHQFQFPEKFVLCLGSEQFGLSPEIRDACSHVVRIPMVGMVQSYNISVAASLFFYEIFRQRGEQLEMNIRPDKQKRGDPPIR
jgi:tRNA G18 (ribose-2'-O)-methylase SpoU